MKIGITLQGYNISTDIPYSGFFRMRRDIAYMMSDDIGVWYEKMPTLLHCSGKEKAVWGNSINKAINDYIKTHIKSMMKVVNFLFLPDCEGRIAYGTCRLICKILAHQIQGGFSTLFMAMQDGEKKSAAADIYRILKNCSDNKKPLQWF